jgi:Rieske Fe-S protein
MSQSLDRRALLGGAATLAAVGVAATACGGGTDTSTAAPPTKATGIGGAGEPVSPASQDAASALNGIGNAADVPVGGGVVVEAQKVVVTQPTAGQFKAFSAVCTHQGCLVSKVTVEGISCACHGSVFSATDGSVVQGPAKDPLAEQKITVDNGAIKLGDSPN